MATISKQKYKFQDENILKAFHQIAERENSFGDAKSLEKFERKAVLQHIRLMKKILLRLKKTRIFKKKSRTAITLSAIRATKGPHA